MTHRTQPRTRDYKPRQVWLLAARPKTLWASATPVLMGGAMGLRADGFHWTAFAAALIAALLIQIGTNFVNDLFDFLRETDTAERLGPIRVTQAGLVSPADMKKASTLVFGLAVLSGLFLVIHGGLVIFIIGVLSILFGILYTAGPYPLGYNGWADLIVLIFFGPIAVAGSYYVSTLELTRSAILVGIPAGMIATAILTVNNLRDYHSDKAAGKRTLAVRFGRRFARWEYLVLVVGATAFPAIIWLLEPDRPWVFLAMLSLMPGVNAINKVMKRSGSGLNEVLAQTGRIMALFGILFAIGWNL